ncbi:hypothetical protein [Roseovarius sp.]|uniref:hypothetical protein n=1 Tax=Roseovarius sp. TaxID=1486281 RepID=UPI0025DAA703|nr:hypothetical protein [Roseovarius sp.]
MIRNMLLIGSATLILASCTTWDTSNVKRSRPAAATASVSPETVIVTSGDITDRPYKKISDLKVTVNKTTALHPSPTPEMVVDKLRTEAASIGANAVINAKVSDVTISAFSWGTRIGTGEAVTFSE